MPRDEDESKERRGPRLDERRIRDGEWWLAKARGTEPGPMISGLVQTMMMQQQWRLDRYRHIARVAGLDELLFGSRLERQDALEAVIGIQSSRKQETPILKNIVDSLQADVYKNQILPMPITSRGNWLQQRRAKDLGCFLEGVFYENKWSLLQLKAGLFVLYFGDAWLKGSITPKGRVGLELLPPWEVWVDEVEARYGCPRSWFHTYLIDRSVVYEQFVARKEGNYGTPEKRALAIENAQAESALWLSFDSAMPTRSDMIMVYEAWHLESGPDAGDGRHTICIKGIDGTMVDEEWNDHDEPPLRVLSAQVNLAGVHCTDSVAWRLTPSQERLDFLDARVDRAIDQVGLPRIYVQKGTINKEDINDSDEVPILEINGGNMVPGTLDWTPIHEQVLAWRGNIKQEMYESSGANQLQTNGSLPPGMSDASGKALDTFDDIFSARHAVKHKLLEQFCIAGGDLTVDVATDIAETRGDYVVKYEKKSYFRRISWKEVKIDRDDFILKTFPISWLSRMPSMRFKQLDQLLNRQVIDVQQFKRLWDIPDIESELGFDTAEQDVIDEMLDQIAYKGIPTSPDEFVNPDLCIKRGKAVYNMLKAQEGYPAERLILIADFVTESIALKQRMSQPAAPPAGAPPGPGAPMPPGGPGGGEAMPPGAPPGAPPPPMAPPMAA